MSWVAVVLTILFGILAVKSVFGLVLDIKTRCRSNKSAVDDSLKGDVKK